MPKRGRRQLDLLRELTFVILEKEVGCSLKQLANCGSEKEGPEFLCLSVSKIEWAIIQLKMYTIYRGWCSEREGEVDRYKKWTLDPIAYLDKMTNMQQNYHFQLINGTMDVRWELKPWRKDYFPRFIKFNLSLYILKFRTRIPLYIRKLGFVVIYIHLSSQLLLMQFIHPFARFLRFSQIRSNFMLFL